jgi:hypothetical protein
MKTIKISIITLAAAIALAGCKEKKSEASAPGDASQSSKSITDVNASDLKEAAKNMAKEAVNELPYAAEVQKVLEKMKDIPTSANDIVSGNITAEKAESLLKSLKEIPIADTPEDFQSAYNEVVKSYDEVCELAKKLPTKEALADKTALAKSLVSSISSDNGADVTATVNEIKSSFADLNKSREKLAEIAKKYVK